MVDTTQKRLLDKVKEHELLYNWNLEEYKNTEKRKEIWTAIGSELNRQASDCEAEWTELMEKFSKMSIGTVNQEHDKWELQEHMSFLLPFIKIPDESRQHRKSSSRASLASFLFPVTGPPPTPEEACEQALFNEDIMKLVFRHSELKDQNTLRLVCTQWYVMAHKFWVNSMYVAEKKMGRENVCGSIADIKMRPLLKKFVCTWEDEKKTEKVIECVLQYVEELHHLEVVNISSVCVKAVMRKYKNLKSISLGENSPHLLRSVTLLGSCSSLEKLELQPVQYKKKNESSSPEICNVISEKFPHLKELGFMSVTNCDTIKALNKMLKKRNKDLISLRLVICHYSRSISEAVNTCSSLQTLHLEVHSPKHSFKLCGFKRLKNLSITFKGDYKENVVTQTLSNDTPKSYLQSLERLTLQLNDKDYNLGMLELITKNLSTLKKLRLIGVDKQIMDSQLKYVTKLSNLHTLQINNANITIRGINYITECKKLKSLKLIDCQLDKGVLIPLVTDLSLDKLQFCPSDIFGHSKNSVKF